MNKNILTLGNNICESKKWSIGTESSFMKDFEGVEGYTTIYGYYNLPVNDKVINTRNEEFLKECGLCFDRLVFDLDNKTNPFEAIKQGKKLIDFFRKHFSDLDMELWYSGSKGAHVYIYFEPITVKNPKLIYARIFDRLKNDLGYNFLDSALKNIYAGLLRVKNSKHPNTGYYKVNLTQAFDTGLIKSMEDIYQIAQNPTVSVPKFNHDNSFIDFMMDLDESVTCNDADYKTDNQYITSDDMEPLKKALLSLWIDGQRDTVGFPLLHCLWRAGKTEQEATDFFSCLPKSEFIEIMSPKIRATYHNPLMHKVGIPTLKRNWRECGATNEDLMAIDDYFSIIKEDSIFYPYKAPLVDDSNLELPKGWTVTENKDPKFTFKKDNTIVRFKNKYLCIICDGKKSPKHKFDKRSLSKICKDTNISEMDLESLYDYTVLYHNNRENEYKILLRELNTRLGAGEVVKTARTVVMYFYRRQAYSTPKGTVMMGTDNVGRFLTQRDLIQILYDDFKPNQIITDDLFKFIHNLPAIEPDYNMIRCKNGFFDFNTKEFLTKSDKPIVVLKESPYNYRPELIGTPVPNDLQLLFDNLHNCSVNGLLEVIGYCLTDGNPLKIVPIFIGEGDSGKTVIMVLTGNLLGNHVSSVNIFNIENTDITLITEDLNLMSEFTGTNRAGLAKLKNYTGNESLEFKTLYKNPEPYRPEAISKTIISTNDLNDMHKSISKNDFNRFTCWIEFVKSYDGAPDRTIQDRILSNPDTMDWLLTNAIHAYVTCDGDLEAMHTRKETMQMVHDYDHPVENKLLDTFEYIPFDEQRIYADTFGYKYMDERDFLIEHGVTTDDIKNFYEAQGELVPKQILPKIRKIFNDNNINRVVKTVNGKSVQYILGLIHK